MSITDRERGIGAGAGGSREVDLARSASSQLVEATRGKSDSAKLSNNSECERLRREIARLERDIRNVNGESSRIWVNIRNWIRIIEELETNPDDPANLRFANVDYYRQRLEMSQRRLQDATNRRRELERRLAATRERYRQQCPNAPGI